MEPARSTDDEIDYGTYYNEISTAKDMGRSHAVKDDLDDETTTYLSNTALVFAVGSDGEDDNSKCRDPNYCGENQILSIMRCISTLEEARVRSGATLPNPTVMLKALLGFPPIVFGRGKKGEN